MVAPAPEPGRMRAFLVNVRAMAADRCRAPARAVVLFRHLRSRLSSRHPPLSSSSSSSPPPPPPDTTVATAMKPPSPVDSKDPSEADEPRRRPPRDGEMRMVHLKTKEECRLANETIQVWTVELPSKHAEGILKVIKDHIRGQDAVDLQHLRRFAKPKYLPAHVLGLPDKVKELHAVSRAWDSAAPCAMQAATTTAWEGYGSAKTRVISRPPTLHLLVCPVHVIPLPDLHGLLLEHTPFASSPESWAYPLEIKEITVPMLAPTSPEQAALWSADYWPTFYRKTNPFGAHPATIAKAEDDLHDPAAGNIGVLAAMALAQEAADEMCRRGFGVGPGCAIVERVGDATEILAVAGDARFHNAPRADTDTDTATAAAPSAGVDASDGGIGAGGCQGNVMGHAVMRAVGMIGRKRLRVASQPITTKAAKAERTFATCGLNHDERARDAFFLDLPLTQLERVHFERDNIKPDGYLCLRLEIFLTHEPCIMCSMALVHSRVGRVIFTHRMADTGGLTAEMVSNHTGPVGLGYGLCWRKELNWQFMCWEYIDPATRVITPPPPPPPQTPRPHGNVDRDLVAKEKPGEQEKGQLQQHLPYNHNHNHNHDHDHDHHHQHLQKEVSSPLTDEIANVSSFAANLHV